MKKILATGGVVILGIILIIGAVRFLSGEDNWICQDGQWVRHGNPSAEMPSEVCEEEQDHNNIGFSEVHCDTDINCACGRHKDTGECFFGNADFVDTSNQCPDFCTRISGDRKVACVKNTCQNLNQGDSINSFTDCVDAGYPVMESYPRQCAVSGDQTFTEDIGNELEKIDVIRIDNPRPNQVIASPLTITGQAKGWYFEGSFPIKLLDGNGQEIVSYYATAQTDWMVDDFVEFRSVLQFERPTSKTGVLILQKDNPSGLPENDDELRIPVRFE